MLSAAVDSYVALRRTLGFRLKDTEMILRDFVAFASAKQDTHLCTRTVLEWIRSANGSPLRNSVRLRTVVRFARYLHAEDNRHEVPPDSASGRHRPHRRPPFLFTPGNVAALVRAARTLGPEGALQPHLYSTLFGLIASTGLRISEALNLRFEDVTPDGLIIRNSKFAKSRLLPLHPSTRTRLKDYLECRLQEAGACDFVFISVKGVQLHANTVRGIFRQLVESLGRQPMTPLAPIVTTFFRNHLAIEKGVSKNTIASYSYAFKFLCRYVSDRVGKSPSALALEDLDARMVREYLEHLEQDCSNTSRTRNLRLTAIRSFMKYVEYEVPSALEQTPKFWRSRTSGPKSGWSTTSPERK